MKLKFVWQFAIGGFDEAAQNFKSDPGEISENEVRW